MDLLILLFYKINQLPRALARGAITQTDRALALNLKNLVAKARILL
jgi:hypothetical protein